MSATSKVVGSRENVGNSTTELWEAECTHGRHRPLCRDPKVGGCPSLNKQAVGAKTEAPSKTHRRHRARRSPPDLPSLGPLPAAQPLPAAGGSCSEARPSLPPGPGIQAPIPSHTGASGLLLGPRASQLRPSPCDLHAGQGASRPLPGFPPMAPSFTSGTVPEALAQEPCV